jgi:hypothetical protein
MLFASQMSISWQQLPYWPEESLRKAGQKKRRKKKPNINEIKVSNKLRSKKTNSHRFQS